jgi:molybdenum cofactor sulfurtransferase
MERVHPVPPVVESTNDLLPIISSNTSSTILYSSCCSCPWWWKNNDGSPTIHKSIIIAAVVICFLAIILAWKKRWHTDCKATKIGERSRPQTTKAPAAAIATRPETRRHEERFARKEAFLQSLSPGESYGGGGANVVDFDQWREREFPGLIRPVSSGLPKEDFVVSSSPFLLLSSDTTNSHCGPVDADDKDNDRMVYLDHAGAALPTQSQLYHIYQEAAAGPILANPHSTGPAASYTKTCHEKVKMTILDHFHAHPQRVLHYCASTNDKNDTNNSDDAADGDDPADDAEDSTTTGIVRGGVGYELIYTSGTTEAMRIVAEWFPWHNDNNHNNNNNNKMLCHECDQQGPQLAYALQSHTSVVGMRGVAQNNNQNVTITCKPMEELLRDFAQGAAWCRCRISCRNGGCPAAQNNKLLVLPLECNFTGDCYSPAAVRQTLQQASRFGWYTFLDIAKAAGTNPVDLSDLNPDFAAVSYYKLFGEPTGLGSLFVKRSSIGMFTPNHIIISDHDGNHNNNNNNKQENTNTNVRQSIRRYFGGGSVDVVVPGSDFAVSRSEPTALAAIPNGTIHFRGIVALRHGFAEIERYGGMHKVHLHTACLARELVQRLEALTHCNGHNAITIYGSWANSATTTTPCRDLSMCGSIVSFNVVRSDGQPLGYNEVSKLAALNTPPIQLRTGCFLQSGGLSSRIGVIGRRNHP